MKHKGPLIGTFDIETWPYLVKAWQMGEQYVRHDRIIKDRAVACFGFKYMHEDKVRFFSTEGQKDPRNDKRIMKELHRLLDSCDIVITQNGKRFDEPIVRGRFSVHGLGPVVNYKHYDTCQMARKMGLPSSRLDYLTATYAPELRKLKHKKFPGDELWDECEAGNKAAWREMAAYNMRDVEGTEAVFKALAPFFNIDFSVYHEGLERVCSCGSTEFKQNGHQYSPAGKFRRFKCKKCGANYQEKGQANNLLSEAKRASLRGKVG